MGCDSHVMLVIHVTRASGQNEEERDTENKCDGTGNKKKRNI